MFYILPRVARSSRRSFHLQAETIIPDNKAHVCKEKDHVRSIFIGDPCDDGKISIISFLLFETLEIVDDRALT